MRAKSWISELYKQAKPDIIIALAGNKSDLESHRSVKYEEASNYAEENYLISFKHQLKLTTMCLKFLKEIPLRFIHNEYQKIEDDSTNERKKTVNYCK